MHDRAEHVLAADEAAVEERQARRHQHDEGGAHQHPGGVSCADLGHSVWLLQRGGCAGSLEADADRGRGRWLDRGTGWCAGCTIRVGRAASSSGGGRVPSRMARAAIAADAGPVEMPHGPCPAQTKRPATSRHRADERPPVDRLRPRAHPPPDELGIDDRRQERGRASQRGASRSAPDPARSAGTSTRGS